MKTDQVVKYVIKEEPVRVKEAVAGILKQKIAEQFKNSVSK
jgi:hypothetical protein